jgi:O-methyltransferase domain
LLCCAETLPAAKGSGDLYVMRVVLHDWSNEKTVEILTNVRKAIGELPCIHSLPALLTRFYRGTHRHPNDVVLHLAPALLHGISSIMNLGYDHLAELCAQAILEPRWRSWR